MTIEKIDAPSANISLPLNQSIQQANGAQFALMLSLMMESLPVSASRAVQRVATPVNVAEQPVKNFNLEMSQTRALQNHQMHHFHLLHSLYEERVMPVDTVLQQTKADLGLVDEVLQGIEGSRSIDPVTGREAEKVSFAA
ncbi:hypothetical protein imdm_1911 [gamma proteobacterium IMCC2047]|nr:hypothetical protein imdm_1911 [gamma proteobacterium IMCC2047]